MTGKSRVGASNKNHNRYCLNILHPKQISTGTVFKQIIESRQQVKNTTGSLESVSASNKNFNRYCFDTNYKAVQQIKNHNRLLCFFLNQGSGHEIKTGNVLKSNQNYKR